MACAARIYDEMKIMDGIAKLLDEKGIKPADLSRMTGLPEDRLSKWFNHEGMPKIHQAHQMAKALGTTIDALLGDAPPSLRILTPDEMRLLGAYEVLRYTITVDEAIRRMGTVPSGLTGREGDTLGSAQG